MRAYFTSFARRGSYRKIEEYHSRGQFCLAWRQACAPIAHLASLHNALSKHSTATFPTLRKRVSTFMSALSSGLSTSSWGAPTLKSMVTIADMYPSVAVGLLRQHRVGQSSEACTIVAAALRLSGHGEHAHAMYELAAAAAVDAAMSTSNQAPAVSEAEPTPRPLELRRRLDSAVYNYVRISQARHSLDTALDCIINWSPRLIHLSAADSYRGATRSMVATWNSSMSMSGCRLPGHKVSACTGDDPSCCNTYEFRPYRVAIVATAAAVAYSATSPVSGIQPSDKDHALRARIASSVATQHFKEAFVQWRDSRWISLCRLFGMYLPLSASSLTAAFGQSAGSERASSRLHFGYYTMISATEVAAKSSSMQPAEPYVALGVVRAPTVGILLQPFWPQDALPPTGDRGMSRTAVSARLLELGVAAVANLIGSVAEMIYLVPENDDDLALAHGIHAVADALCSRWRAACHANYSSRQVHIHPGKGRLSAITADAMIPTDEVDVVVTINADTILLDKQTGSRGGRPPDSTCVLAYVAAGNATAAIHRRELPIEVGKSSTTKQPCVSVIVALLKAVLGHIAERRPYEDPLDLSHNIEQALSSDAVLAMIQRCMSKYEGNHSARGGMGMVAAELLATTTPLVPRADSQDGWAVPGRRDRWKHGFSCLKDKVGNVPLGTPAIDALYVKEARECGLPIWGAGSAFALLHVHAQPPDVREARNLRLGYQSIQTDWSLADGLLPVHVGVCEVGV